MLNDPLNELLLYGGTPAVVFQADVAHATAQAEVATFVGGAKLTAIEAHATAQAEQGVLSGSLFIAVEAHSTSQAEIATLTGGALFTGVEAHTTTQAEVAILKDVEYLRGEVAHASSTDALEVIMLGGADFHAEVAHALGHASVAIILGRFVVRTTGCSTSEIMLPEHDMYIAPDGTEYDLSIPGLRWVLDEEGTGMPIIDYVTHRGPFQHGVTVTDFFLEPRVVQLIIRQQYNDRNLQQRGRQALLDILRPNRQAQVGQFHTGKLRKHLSTGQVMDLNVLIQQGPAFAPRSGRPGWDEWAFTETLRFIAFDPLYYGIQESISALSDDVVITLYTYSAAGVVLYTGNFIAYPTIEVHGPLTNFTITNVTTGESIELDYTLPDGRFLTFDLTPGIKSVTLDDGTNLIGYVANDDLALFHLEPDINNLTVTGADGSLDTEVVIKYIERFIGR